MSNKLMGIALCVLSAALVAGGAYEVLMQHRVLHVPEHKITAAPAGTALEPPQGSFGVKLCGEIVVWVFLKDGKVIRMDKDHHPATKEDTQKFLEWLDSGPSDVVDRATNCPVGT